MRIFTCGICSNMVFFENSRCEVCQSALGYDPLTNLMFARAKESEAWLAPGLAELYFKPCDNIQYGACNWLVPGATDEKFCLACRHNHLVPDLSLNDNLAPWRKVESAKQRLFYSLCRLNLPLPVRGPENETGLAFDFVLDAAGPSGEHFMTGHDNGLITLNLEEADDAIREQRRTALNEPYRTLLGHFRHEIGHFYWDQLVCDSRRQQNATALFGDASLDYAEALKVHYGNGAPADWRERYVTAYASAHPWEDFAETWAHYLHIVDTVETAESFGVRVTSKLTGDSVAPDKNPVDPYFAKDFNAIVSAWLPVTIALNGVNRSMGLPDLYPFVLTAPAIEKLAFIHDLVHADRETYGVKSMA